MTSHTKNRTMSIFILFSALPLACHSDYQIMARKPDIDPADVTNCDFEPISSTRMSRFLCNPVFTQTDEAWNNGVSSIGFHVTEVLGHPFFQIWYTSRTVDSYGVGYAVSDNGMEWTVHPSNPIMTSTEGEWDQDALEGQIVTWDSKREAYIMAYQGVTLGVDDFDDGTWGLGIATSTDGVLWNKQPQNPVIDFINDFTLEFNQRPCWPLTLKITDTGYTGYIASSTIGSGNACNIYSLSSNDLIQWELNSETPILTAGFSYDRLGFADAAVVEWQNTETDEKTLYMFYVGYADLINQGNHAVVADTSVGLATSTDNGQSWEKRAMPFPIQQTEIGQITSIGAKIIGSRIHLWIGDTYNNNGAIGYFYYEPDIEPHE